MRPCTLFARARHYSVGWTRVADLTGHFLTAICRPHHPRIGDRADWGRLCLRLPTQTLRFRALRGPREVMLQRQF